MAAPSAAQIHLLQACRTALEKFQSSNSKLRIVASITPPSQPKIQNSNTSREPSRHALIFPRTLFILDSSYNPPSRAHAVLATSALYAVANTAGELDSSRRNSKPATKSLTKDKQWKYPGPARLLLLFSTANADKAAKPAAFEHRLATLVLFAEDLAKQWSKGHQTARSDLSTVADNPSNASLAQTVIDIGLTTEPIYHAKSAAISSAATDASHHPSSYPEPGHSQAPNSHIPVDPTVYLEAQHIHLVGYDTITRIFNPKYYTSHNPPLSALNEYFSHHGFRVTVRPASSDDSEKEEQLRWVQDNLAGGQLEAEGGKREWADCIEMVEAPEDIGDISSTRVREAVVSSNWSDVERCCSRQVAEWVRAWGLYGEGT